MGRIEDSIVFKELVQIARSMIDGQDFNPSGNRAVKHQIVFKAGNGEKANVSQTRIPIFSRHAKAWGRGDGLEGFADRLDDPRCCIRIVLGNERPNVPKLALGAGRKDEPTQRAASP